LHAFRLSFLHPLDGQPVHFEAPRPEDIENLLATLEIEAA
jgi:23S rRNA pseudouridine1911/1915/1917 synthase